MRYLTPVLFAATSIVLSTAPAYADLGDQLFKLLPDDGAADNAPEACGGVWLRFRCGKKCLSPLTTESPATRRRRAEEASNGG